MMRVKDIVKDNYVDGDDDNSVRYSDGNDASNNRDNGDDVDNKDNNTKNSTDSNDNTIAILKPKIIRETLDMTLPFPAQKEIDEKILDIQQLRFYIRIFIMNLGRTLPRSLLSLSPSGSVLTLNNQFYMHSVSWKQKDSGG